MLVLTRRVDEVITIGDPHSDKPPIEIQLVAVRGDQVRIGVNAPPEVVVDRREIWDEKQREKGGA